MPKAVTRNAEDGLSYVVALVSKFRSPPLILVAGGSCSGKSYFAVKLKERFFAHSESAGVVQLDYYFKDLNDPTLPKNADGRRLFDLPESYHLLEYKLAVAKLVNGLGINMPNYDFVTSRRLNGLGPQIGPAEVIIAEGLFAISVLCSDYPSALKIYIDTDQELCLERRISRDTVRYGVSREVVKNNFISKVFPYHLRLVEPQKSKADVIIRGP